MKCPKCNYLGFETGNRCKNCGYDFSLLTEFEEESIDIDISPQDTASDTPSYDWVAAVDSALGTTPGPSVHVDLVVGAREPSTELPAAANPPEPPVPVETPRRAVSTLPLFTPDLSDDTPLVKLPATPRPPLAVRRTPDTPRLRPMAKAIEQPQPEAGLAFEQPPSERPVETAPLVRRKPDTTSPVRRREGVWADPEAARPVEAGPSGARVAAAIIDLVMLAAIDFAVVYFTLRIAGLSMDEWAALPPGPMIVFLLLVKMSYFSAFTAVGGQTIGKMAARIRVVSADGRPIDAALALKRTLAGGVSAAFLGLGFIAALFDSERRALHDHLAGTRVVTLRSA